MISTSSTIRLLATLSTALSIAASTTNADTIIYTTTATTGASSLVPSGGGYSFNLISSSGEMEISSGTVSLPIVIEEATADLPASDPNAGGDLHPTLDVTITDVTTNESGTFEIQDATLGVLVRHDIPMTTNPPMPAMTFYEVTLTNQFSIPSGKPTMLNFGGGTAFTLLPRAEDFFTSIGGGPHVEPGTMLKKELVLTFAVVSPAAVPEPGSLTLMLLGIGGVGLMAITRRCRVQSRAVETRPAS